MTRRIRCLSSIALSTNILGRYAIVDVPAGPNKLSGAILVNGQVTSLGGESFYLVPIRWL